MKSAYELAMERMEKASGPSRKLDDSQKAAISEIEKRGQAKIAEIRLSYEGRIAAATSQDEFDGLQQELHQRIADIEERTEIEKNNIWEDGQ